MGPMVRQIAAMEPPPSVSLHTAHRTPHSIQRHQQPNNNTKERAHHAEIVCGQQLCSEIQCTMELDVDWTALRSARTIESGAVEALDAHVQHAHGQRQADDDGHCTTQSISTDTTNTATAHR